MDVIKNLEALPHKYARLARECAKKEATYKNIEEQKKAYLARLKIEYSYGQKMSQVEITMLAEGSKEWQQYLWGLTLAQKAYLKAKAELNVAEITFECLRSINSYTKKEMTIL